MSRHRVPSELLSDRGQAFLSGLLKEVERALGYKKVNTTAYHPQTDGLVERFNRTLISMLAKTVERDGKDWDQQRQSLSAVEYTGVSILSPLREGSSSSYSNCNGC